MLMFGGLTAIPLVPDLYADLTIALANTGPWVSTRGTLDAAGKNTQARLVLPAISDQGVIGLVFYHAYLVYDAQNNFHMASNPVTLQLVAPGCAHPPDRRGREPQGRPEGVPCHSRSAAVPRGQVWGNRYTAGRSRAPRNGGLP